MYIYIRSSLSWIFKFMFCVHVGIKLAHNLDIRQQAFNDSFALFGDSFLSDRIIHVLIVWDMCSLAVHIACCAAQVLLRIVFCSAPAVRIAWAWLHGAHANIRGCLCVVQTCWPHLVCFVFAVCTYLWIDIGSKFTMCLRPHLPLVESLCPLTFYLGRGRASA